jgi:Putative prokaryotic signal transducing protein
MKTGVIQSFDNYFSANIILTKLQDAGINCFLKDEYSATLNPTFSNSIGGIKLLVNLNDIERANELILIFEEEYLRSIACPICSNNEIVSVVSIMQRSFLEKFLAKIFSDKNIPVEKSFKCEHCNWKSKLLPERTILLS